MKKTQNKLWQKMDEMSSEKIPFFFMIDFLMENVLIFGESDLLNKKILVDFPSFKNTEQRHIAKKEIQFHSYAQRFEEYQKGFSKVQSHLRLGNSYLVNYTCNTPVETNLSLEEIFYLSSAKYKVLLPEKFTFFSPETFVEIKNQRVYTHPMKGTIDADKENAIEALKEDVKEKAEHYTVVDLLRNDLSMIADDVQLDEFQRIDFIKTRQKNLYAMSSEISGNVKPEFQNKIGSIMKTLLPAGSILGAPKKKTMQIILEAENYSRGYYTGICGWFDGENLDSCVMIRFIEKKENNQLFFKSGGGITHLSNAKDEYNEMKNKIYVPIY